jgi:cell division protein ZapE
MILGRLLSNCFERGIVFVMTSNYHPDRLYPDGLQRQNFLPTIALIKEKMDIVEVDSGVDYRRRTLEQDAVYHTPLGAAAEARLSATFNALATKQIAGKTIRLYERDITVRKRAEGVIWFDFDALCETPRSQNDYLELAQEHHTLILSNVPVLATKESNVIRRFTLLIDVLYDHRVKLVMSAAATLNEISRIDEALTDGDTRRVLSEFTRTTSRLTEMQSAEYMSEAHISSLAP